MFKKCLSIVFALVLLAVCCSCAGKAEEGTSSDVNSTPTESEISNVPTEGDVLTMLNIKVKQGEYGGFQNTRPYDSKKEDISLILVTGQSNFTTSVGYSAELGALNSGKTSNVPEDPIKPRAGIAYSFNTYSSSYELSTTRDMNTLCDTKNGTSTLGGVSPSFAIEWNALTNTKVVFVQAAVGAVGVHEWVPDPSKYACTCAQNGKGALYANAVSGYRKAYEALSQKYNIVYTGYIWNQGEHDEVYGKNEANTVHDAKSYYDAYMEMHTGLMETLKLDFGGISVVRADRAGSTAEGSNSYTIARAAQYKLCNDNADLFMLSTISETCSHAQMDQGNTIHYAQSTFNIMGIEMADNLYKYLGLAEAEYTGIKIYSADGTTACVFDKDGNLVSGSDTLTKDNIGKNMIVRLDSLGTHHMIETSFTIGDSDGSQYVDSFGAVDWIELDAGKSIKQFKVKVVTE